MKKISSMVAVIVLMIATTTGLNSCNNQHKKDDHCEKASCCKHEKCCDKCSDKCTSDNKCCDKCTVGKEESCCKKDTTASTRKEMQKDCCKKGAPSGSHTGMYACPMHKEITSDKPGKCSTCGMEMEKQRN